MWLCCRISFGGKVSVVVGRICLHSALVYALIPPTEQFFRRAILRQKFAQPNYFLHGEKNVEKKAARETEEENCNATIRRASPVN